MKRIWIVLGIVAGVIVIVAAGYLGFRSTSPEQPVAPQAPETVTVDRCDVEQSVTAPGSVVNVGQNAVSMPVDGALAEVRVRPGDVVRAGDVLATLRSDPVQLARAQLAVVEAQKKLISAQADRNRYNYAYSPDPEDIEVAQARLVLAGQQLNQVQADYDSLSGLSAEDPAKAMALLALENARSEQRRAQYAFNLAQGITPSATDVALADANLALAQADLDKAQAVLDLLTAGVVSAPFDGVILDVQAKIGQTVPAGTGLFSLHRPSDIEVRANVVEEDYPYLEVGQKAELYFDALPEAAAVGTVARILPVRAAGDRPLYFIFIELDSVPDRLVDGMTADAAIQIAVRPQVLCLPRAVVHASSGSTATIKVWNGVTSEPRQIEIGLRGDVYLEILSGLEEGERVVTR